jgi:ribosomal protein S18 acetylase RimI-like enzyme
MNHTYLWENPDRDGGLDGWALLTPGWSSFDVFVNPTLSGSQRAQAMYAWAEERITAIAAAQGRSEIYTIWNSAADELMAAYFKARVFELHAEHHVQMRRSLNDDLPPAELPHGYQVRNVSGESEVELRAAASYAAFQSEKPWESYVRRYRKFMHSPVYRAEHDLVVAAPNGRLASFCIIWLDGKQGRLFELVGTYPDFQRMGLGKALMLEGLQRMKQQGMQAAIVNTDHDNQAALGLYRSAGFQEGDRLLMYIKRLI